MSLTQNFIEQASKDISTPVAVVVGDQDTLPSATGQQSITLEKSVEETNINSIVETAAKQTQAAILHTTDTDFIPESEEVTLDFSALDFYVPFICNSYDQLATLLLGNIFLAESVTSLNIDFFGDLLINAAPFDCAKVAFGNHSFIIREDNADRIVLIHSFLAEAKNELLENKCYRCNLTKPVNVNGSTAYTLVLTPKDLRDIKQSYPNYKLSYVNSEKIEDLQLVIKVV